MQKRAILGVLSTTCLIFQSCGGGGSASEKFDFNGKWKGEVVVQVDSGSSTCQYFAGQYPLEWTLAQRGQIDYNVLDGENLLGVAIGNSDLPTVLTLEFSQVENHPPDINDTCRGSETVRLSQSNQGDLEWDYRGSANCGSGGMCEYSGTGILIK